jgi:hypothetical protein
MQTSFLVVDNFLDNAMALREHALTLQYPPQEGRFAGRNSLERINIDGLTEAVSRLVGEQLAPAPPPQSHGKCRLTLAGDRGPGKVHVDDSHWSGILYLSRDEDSVGGTDFFRHKASGMDHLPLTPDDLQRAGYSTPAEAHRDTIEINGTNDEAWEHLTTIHMRFNRLLLLRPFLYHTAGPGFGDRPEHARLVYLMFFVRAVRGS